MIVIRKATKDDLAKILSLMRQLIEEHQVLDNYYKSFTQYQGLRDYVLKSIKNRSKLLLVAEVGGRVAAYFIGAIEPAPFYSVAKKIGVVADTSVDKSFRRQGILKMLFQEALRWFKKKKVNYIELSVDLRNKVGVAAWEKLGFVGYKIRMRRAWR